MFGILCNWDAITRKHFKFNLKYIIKGPFTLSHLFFFNYMRMRPCGHWPLHAMWVYKLITRFKHIWIYTWILDNSNRQHGIPWNTKPHLYGAWWTWNINIQIFGRCDVVFDVFVPTSAHPLSIFNKWFVQIDLTC